MIASSQLAWPADDVGHAITALADAVGIDSLSHASVPRPPRSDDPRGMSAWIEGCAESMGIEAEPVCCSYAELPAVLASIAPAIIRVIDSSKDRYLAVVTSDVDGVDVITPMATRRSLSAQQLRSLVAAGRGGDAAQRVEHWISVAGIAKERRPRAKEVLLPSMLADRSVDGMWILRADPGSSFTRQLRERKVPLRALVFVAGSALQVAISVASWLVIGRAFGGALEPGWIKAWILLSVSTIPIQLVTSRMASNAALDVAVLLKRRLLAGALRLHPREIRARGSGGLLALISESEAVESAGFSSIAGALVAVIQLMAAGGVLLAGVSGALHVVLLFGWCLALALLGLGFARRRAEWTTQRFGQTASFVENVIGNRTRLAQEPAGLRHSREDASLQRYAASSTHMDDMHDWMASLPSRGWLILAFLGLAPSLLSEPIDSLRLAVTVGGILLAQAGLSTLLGSTNALLAAGFAWRSVGRLFAAAAHRESPGIFGATGMNGSNSRDLDAPPVKNAPTVLEARDLTFRHRPETAPSLSDLSLAIREGDRVLVRGPSGGGKSTLLSVLSGLHPPSNGLLLVGGLDRTVLGARRIRQQIANVPQFHENHLLSGTLAFNLLMGREWPASPDDMQEAEAICRELGLGPMLDKMPSGLHQIIGETGWQLSHGERSRVFLARALLQRAHVVLLDETFGALDPLTFRQCLTTVLLRAPTLVVVAHL